MSQPIAAIDLVSGVARVGGLAFFAGLIATVTALLYRWYTRDVVPVGLTVLLGLAGIALYLNTTAALGQVIQDPLRGRGLFDLEAALVNVVTFLAGAVAATVGRRVGDTAAEEISAVSGARAIDADVGRLVRRVGRLTPVTIPEADAIEDIEGYDPVPAATKEAMGGKTLLFPGRLTVAELRDRLASRLKEDYDVGHVGVDVSADGDVEYLGVGSRAAGIGPTLPQGAGVTALRADPPFAATSGDVVQLWTDAPEPERVATAELRGKAEDVVTLSLDAAEAEALDPTRRYRLVTLPADPRPEQEFASLLRSADETMGVATVEDGSALVDVEVGSIDATVVAVRAEGGAVEAVPPRSRTLSVGETVYAIGRPETLRRLEAEARPGEAESSS